MVAIEGEKVDTTRMDYTTKEAAELAGVSSAYIRRLLIDRKIKGRNVGGRLWLIDGRDLARWLDERG